MNFPGGSICSSNRHEFSRRAYRKDESFFKEVLSVRRTDLLSHRTDTNFPRNPYLVLEHIRIFQEPLFCHRTVLIFQEALSSPPTPTIFQETLSSPRTPTIFQETLSSPRTHTIFQETPMPRTHRHFPGRYPLSNRYFVNRSRWLLSLVVNLFGKDQNSSIMHAILH